MMDQQQPQQPQMQQAVIQQQQQQQQQAMQTPIQLTLTLGEVNGILQAIAKAPYEMAKPLIDKVTEQAQDYVAKMTASQAPPSPNPSANQVSQQVQPPALS